MTGRPGLHTHEPTSVYGVLAWVLAHPWDALGRRWNYKAAILSSLMRAAIFFSINGRAGYRAAIAAMTTELCFRFATSGFYGAMTENFRRVEPPLAGTIAAMIVLPLVSHSLELLVHWLRSTPYLQASIGASVLFTALSTAFNLFAMRRGALVVGTGRRSLLEDMAAMPRLVALFIIAVARSCRRAWA
ncbi:MAG TPA: hypothetical protein VKB50_12895 [Vicinamibacterales bacterium]|nr:hypothetical protein [Vicinamibacterales bacterium]